MRRHARRISETVSGLRGVEKDNSAVRRSGTCVDSSASESGGRLMIAQYNGV